MFRAHRLVWLYVHGRFPTAFVDHINNIRHDNRLNNLRECSHAENNLNIGKRCDNSSGIIGVTWHKETNKWRVRAQVDGKDFSLGLYPTKEEAALARKVFVEQNHGDFAYTV